MKVEIRSHFELKNNMAYQNVWGIAQAVFRDKFLALNAYIRKEE